MLALAIDLLFALAGILAVLTIVDSAIKGRNAYDQLLREGALLRAGFAVQVEAQELRVRRSVHRSERRSAMLRPLPVPACAAA